MKKLLLLVILFFSTTILTAQTFTQPTQYNIVCDDNNDGFASFYLGEITYEILGNLNASDYTITHHETQADATTGTNPLSSPYLNISAWSQTIYVRIVTVATGDIQFLIYNLVVNPIPYANPYTMTVCDDNNDGFVAIDLIATIPIFIQGSPGLIVTFHETHTDAQFGANPLPSPYFNIVPQFQVFNVRVSDAVTGCYTITQLYVSIISCGPTAGQPTNLQLCSDTSTANFDLTANTPLILNTLNPAEYTVTYYDSQSQAEAGVSPIVPANSFSGTNVQVIYARLENNATNEYQIFPFGLAVQAYLNDVVTLTSIDQCDDNNDSLVTFNLTNVQAQINSTNALEYYTGLSNAQYQQLPIANPSVFTVGVQSPTTTIFVREIVPNGCDVIYSFLVRAYAICNLASTCPNANSLCNALGVPFANTHQAASAESGINYGCLATQPNPTWFYLPVSGNGTINLKIEQNSSIAFTGNGLDVDYIVFGPFTDSSACGPAFLNPATTVSCSFSANNIEYPVIPNAVIGQYYKIMVTNYSNLPGFVRISELSTTVGAINCSGLRLNAFLDSNINGTQDSGEQNFPLGQFTYEVNNNGNIHNIISPSGVYNIYDGNLTNSYDLSYTIDSNYASLYNISTPTYSNVNAGEGMSVYNFPITIVQSYVDLAVNIVPVSAPRPGFSYQNKIVYTNNGNQTMSGTVTFTNDALVTITGNTQSGTTPTANGFTYNFTNLLPFETRTMTVTMQVPTLPTVAIGNLLTNTASIAPLTDDVVAENNSSSVSQIILGSYDPNDKMESHGEKILVSSFTSNDYLYYTIRFENSGTASAVNVRVNDVLDSKLDETSIRMISASHSYVLDRLDNNLNWKFDNIQLPVSVANTNTGKGYVTFKVKPRAGYAAGDIIPNTSSIYFDFNPAIVTNTFNTEFVLQLGLNEFENGDFVFYPNPASDIVTISLKNNGSIANIVVYDLLGKMILSQKPVTSESSQTINLLAISKGVYLLEVTTDSNLKVVKKLLVE